MSKRSVEMLGSFDPCANYEVVYSHASHSNKTTGLK